MELYTLHLHKALHYKRLVMPNLDALLAYADSSAEGSECLAIWDIAALVLDTVDGPKLREPQASPLWMGTAAAAHAAYTSHAEAGSEPASELYHNSTSYALGQGSYGFCQAKARGPADLYEILEWFVRESWWSGSKVLDRLYLRLVREDDKTAVQALARNTKLESKPC